MSLTTLPIEVLEQIFLYVDVESLLNAWDAVGLDGCNSFWENICKRECFKKADNEKDICWRVVFQRNMNWRTRRFIKREYNFSFEGGKLDQLGLHFISMPIRTEIQGENLLFKNSMNDSVSVWNIDDSPKLAQTLKGSFLKVQGSKLLLLMTEPVYRKTLYSFDSNMYNKLITSYEHSTEQSTSEDSFYNKNVFSDKFFVYVTIENNITRIKAVNLTNFEEFSLPVSYKKVQYLSLKLSDYLLYIMLLDENQYILRRNNLNSKNWLDDLVLFKGAALISCPILKVSSDLIISWSNLLESRGITPLKIWSKDGKPVTSDLFDSMDAFNRNRLHIPEQILWMVVEGQYVIFSFACTDQMFSITIWNAKYPKDYKDLGKSDLLYNGQQAISSSLLVLSYTRGFKVVDFTKAIYLYEVCFDGYSPSREDVFFVNEYFYVRLRLISKYKHLETAHSSVISEHALSLDGYLPRCESGICNSNVEELPTTYVCIYDFRVKAQSLYEKQKEIVKIIK